MWRKLGLLFGLCVLALGLALPMSDTSFAEPESDKGKAFYKNQYEQSQTRRVVDEHLKKWENEYLNNEFQKLKTEIEKQQKENKVELDILSKRHENKINTLNITSELIYKNSSNIYEAIVFFTTIFGLIFAVIGIFTLGKIHKLESDAKDIIKESKEKIDKCIERAEKGALDIEERVKLTDSLDTKGKTTIKATDTSREVLKRDDADLYIRSLAIQAYNDEKWQSSLYLWEKVLEKEPKDVDALVYAALSIDFLIQENKIPLDNPLWHAAESKYKEVINLNPKYTLPLNNLANLLCHKAKAEKDEDKKNALWDDAESKYKEALNIDPQDTDALNNLASLLDDRAKAEKDEDKRNVLWHDAESKYKEALNIDPMYTPALNNWASLLDDRAKAEKDENKRNVLWHDAESKYKEAITINPKYSNGWNCWAILLCNKAQEDKDEDKKKELLAKANEYCNISIKLDENSYRLDTLATIRTYQGKAEKDKKEQGRLYYEANEIYGKSINLNQNEAETWYNWSKLCKFRAEHATTKDEKDVFLKNAHNYYEKAKGLNPLEVEYLDSIFKDQ